MSNQTMRAEFEAWFIAAHEYKSRRLFSRLSDDRRYESFETEYAWLAYVQGRATSGAASGEVRTTQPMCEFKTNDLIRRGYRKVGYIMANADNTEYALSDASVRWLTQPNYWRLMHEQDGSLFAKPAEQSAPPVPPLDQSSSGKHEIGGAQ